MRTVPSTEHTMNLKLDRVLIQQVEELSNGESVHDSANLIGAYFTAVTKFQQTLDKEFHDIAEEAERNLRAHLVNLRWRKNMFTRE